MEFFITTLLSEIHEITLNFEPNVKKQNSVSLDKLLNFKAPTRDAGIQYIVFE